MGETESSKSDTASRHAQPDLKALQILRYTDVKNDVCDETNPSQGREKLEIDDLSRDREEVLALSVLVSSLPSCMRAMSFV